MRRTIIKSALLVLAITATADLPAQHSLEKIWQTNPALRVPESVLYDARAQVLYVSNINGSPMERDGNGSIAKVSLDGKIIENDWITGLNAPKGMGLHQNLLYVADLTEVVVIDMDKASVIKRIQVEGASFLNDITIDHEGIVYVSDSRTNKVHRIEAGKSGIFIDNIRGANGLLAVGTDLYILSSGSLVKADNDRKLTELAEGMDQSTDGIEMVKENEFIVSCWSGVVYYVKSDGSAQVLLDTRSQGMNSADIGYNAEKKIVYVPTFSGNTVCAYQLK